MEQRIKVLLWVAGLVLLASCATGGSKFEAIYPGMTSKEVANIMGKGPSRADEFPPNHTAWYFGEDRCLLLKDDKVVSKSKTEEKQEIEVIGMGGMKKITKADCAPPGEGSRRRVEREIETPFGTLRK